MRESQIFANCSWKIIELFFIPLPATQAFGRVFSAFIVITYVALVVVAVVVIVIVGVFIAAVVVSHLSVASLTRVFSFPKRDLKWNLSEILKNAHRHVHTHTYTRTHYFFWVNHCVITCPALTCSPPQATPWSDTCATTTFKRIDSVKACKKLQPTTTTRTITKERERESERYSKDVYEASTVCMALYWYGRGFGCGFDFGFGISFCLRVQTLEIFRDNAICILYYYYYYRSRVNSPNSLLTRRLCVCLTCVCVNIYIIIV